MAKERTIVLKPSKSIQYRINAKGWLTVKIKEGNEKETAHFFRLLATLVDNYLSQINGD